MQSASPLSSRWKIYGLFLGGVLLASFLIGCGLFPQSEKRIMHRVSVQQLNTTIKAIERDIGRTHRNLKGSITLALTIDPDGEIDGIEVVSNRLNQPQVEKDILHMFDNIIIESNAQDELRINIPLNFD